MRTDKKLLCALLFIQLLTGGPSVTAPPAGAAEAPWSRLSYPTEESMSRIMDSYHDSLEARIKRPAYWFDDFFGDRRLEDDPSPSSSFRVRLVARLTEAEGLTFPARIHANLVLPGINRRFRVIFFSENQEEGRSNQTDDAVDTSLETGEGVEKPNMGIRYLIFQSLRSKFQFGAGLSLGWPLDYYGRMRFERMLHLGHRNIIRLTETGYWNSLEGFGETSRLDLERVLNAKSSGRISLFGTFSEEAPGLSWGTEFNLFRQLSAKSALAIDIGFKGTNRPSTRIETYQISSRYRKNILRPWLFFEFEPAMKFPISNHNTRDLIWLLTVVLEIHLTS